MLKKISSWVCSTFLFLLLLIVPAQAREETIPITGYVNDYANVLDPQTEADLNAQGEAFASRTGAQVVIVTTDSLHGADAMKVATDSANEAQLGSGELDNGVLILVSIDDKQRFMAVGSGLEGDLTDIDCEHLQQDYLVPAFRQGDYSKGLVDLYEHTIDHIANAYGLDLDDDSNFAPNNAPVTQRKQASFDWTGLFAIGAVLVLGAFVLTKKPSSRQGTTLHLKPHQQYRLTVPGVNFQNDSVVVGSDDPNIATITPDGMVTAHNIGQTRITIQKLDGPRLTYTIVVSRHDSSGGRRRRDSDVFDAFLLGSLLGGRHNGGYRGPRSGGGFGGFGGGGFSGGGGGFRGGGSGGSW